MHGGDIDSVDGRGAGGRSSRRRRGARAALAGTLLALGLLWPAAGQAACQIAVMELPVKMVGTRAIATVGIKGKEVPLMVDSGAFFSMLTEAAAEQLDLPLQPLPRGMEVVGLAGRVEAHSTTVDHLKLLQGEIPHIEFVVGGNEPGAGAMGVLGRNLLSALDTEYDLAHGIIRLVKPNDDCDKSNMAYWAGATPVTELALQRDFGERTTAIRATVLLNGQKVSALFDSGAGTVVSLRAAHRVGIKDSDLTPHGRAAGAGLGKVDSWTAAFDSIDLGGETVLHNRFVVDDFDMENDMLIGIDFFLSHHIYVSKRQSRIYITYNGGPVFALNAGARVTPDADKPADALQPDELARRGAASLARGDLDGALADLDRACTLAPDNAGFHAQRALVRLKLKQRELGLADLDAALRLDPAQDDARITRAALHEQMAQRDAALDDLAELDRRLAPQSNLRRRLATLYVDLGMPAQAIVQWNDWIAAHPNDIGLETAYNSRCWTRVKMNVELEQALDDCDNAVDADSKNPAFRDSRGWAELRLGKPKKALADFDRALEIKPDQGWSLYGRGLAHLGLGEAAAAQADLAAARRIEKNIDDRIRDAGLPTAPTP
jgi:tetratricopeptide (TPR) repeat protein/predicted aspartyl protease